MHQQVTDLIPPYHDGELSAVQRMQVELHLRTCATCREQLAQLKALSALLTATPVEVEATEEFWERLAPRLPAPRPVTSSTPTCVGQRPRQPWLFLPPLGLLFSKAVVEAVMFISMSFYAVHALGLLPTWADRALRVITALPGSLPRNVTHNLFSFAWPVPLPALVDCTADRTSPVLASLAGFVVPSLAYAVALGSIAFLYVTWMAFCWRDMRSAPVRNGNQ